MADEGGSDATAVARLWRDLTFLMQILRQRTTGKMAQEWNRDSSRGVTAISAIMLRVSILSFILCGLLLALNVADSEMQYLSTLVECDMVQENGIKITKSLRPSAVDPGIMSCRPSYWLPIYTEYFNVPRVFQSLLTLPLLFCVTMHYQLLIVEQHLSWNAFLVSDFHMPYIWESKSRLKLQWMVEMAVCSLHTPPGAFLRWNYAFLDRIGTSTNRITDTQVMYLAMSARSYFIIRIVGLYVVGKLRGASIEILRRIAGVEVNLSFSLRYMLINHTSKLLLGFLAVVIIWCSYGIRMCERNFSDSNVLLFSDSVWLALVTAATIGFGDYYPSTHCGRTAAIIAAFAGSEK